MTTEQILSDSQYDKNFRLSAFYHHAIKSIDVYIEEKPEHTRFGSTDRKTYTVGVTLSFKDMRKYFEIDIPPWEEKQKQVIDSAIEQEKNKFALKIADKYMSSSHLSI